MMTRQLTKQEYQKRAMLVQKLAFLLELKQDQSVASILATMFSPHGEAVHPAKWTDNVTLGKVESIIYNVENNIEDEYDR